MTLVEIAGGNTLENMTALMAYIPFLLAACVILAGLGMIPSTSLILIIGIISFFLSWEKCQLLWNGCFSDNIYFLMAILATSSIIKDSLILKKGIYAILYHLASKPKLVDKILFFIGIILTPVLTAQSARIAVMTPVLGSLFEHKTFSQAPKSIQAMMHTTFCGCILLSTIFLSGKSSNYLLLNMLKDERALPNGWLSWLFFASFSGLLLIGVFFVIHMLYYKQDSYPKINRFALLRVMATLPANGWNEFTGVLMLATLLSGMLLMYCLDQSTIPLSLLVIMLPILTGVRHLRQISAMINLSFICYLIAMIGTVSLINAQDIAIVNISGFEQISSWFREPLWCMVAIFSLSWVLNLFLGSLIAPALAFTVLMPIVQSSPIHQWIAIFTILMASEAWVFPYQSSYFTLFRSHIGRYPQCSTTNLIKTNVYMAMFKFLVLLASIPFWKAIGIYP